MDKDTFQIMALRFAQVEPVRQLRNMLSQVRTLKLPVGTDGRCRTILSPFAAKTGRNQPSTSRFIFGLSSWSRNLIKPVHGKSLAYVDWEQQEFGIAAALSGDSTMLAAYTSGDPYLTFAQQAGAAAPDATRHSHPGVREQFKACALAVQYGMGADSLAKRIGTSKFQAQTLLRLHRQTYRRFWAWSDAVLNYALLHARVTALSAGRCE